MKDPKGRYLGDNYDPNYWQKRKRRLEEGLINRPEEGPKHRAYAGHGDRADFKRTTTLGGHSLSDRLSSRRTSPKRSEQNADTPEAWDQYYRDTSYRGQIFDKERQGRPRSTSPRRSAPYPQSNWRHPRLQSHHSHNGTEPPDNFSRGPSTFRTPDGARHQTPPESADTYPHQSAWNQAPADHSAPRVPPATLHRPTDPRLAQRPPEQQRDPSLANERRGDAAGQTHTVASLASTDTQCSPLAGKFQNTNLGDLSSLERFREQLKESRETSSDDLGAPRPPSWIDPADLATMAEKFLKDQQMAAVQTEEGEYAGSQRDWSGSTDADLEERELKETLRRRIQEGDERPSSGLDLSLLDRLVDRTHRHNVGSNSPRTENQDLASTTTKTAADEQLRGHPVAPLPGTKALRATGRMLPSRTSSPDPEPRKGNFVTDRALKRGEAKLPPHVKQIDIRSEHSREPSRQGGRSLQKLLRRGSGSTSPSSQRSRYGVDDRTTPAVESHSTQPGNVRRDHDGIQASVPAPNRPALSMSDRHAPATAPRSAPPVESLLLDAQQTHTPALSYTSVPPPQPLMAESSVIVIETIRALKASVERLERMFCPPLPAPATSFMASPHVMGRPIPYGTSPPFTYGALPPMGPAYPDRHGCIQTPPVVPETQGAAPLHPCVPPHQDDMPQFPPPIHGFLLATSEHAPGTSKAGHGDYNSIHSMDNGTPVRNSEN